MRIIDADDLAKEYQWTEEHTSPQTPWTIKDILNILDEAPTVDAVVLPCKLGAPVFVIGGKYRHGRVEKWINPGKFRLSDLEKMGKTVFLTQEEAEAALEEMEV